MELSILYPTALNYKRTISQLGPSEGSRGRGQWEQITNKEAPTLMSLTKPFPCFSQAPSFQHGSSTQNFPRRTYFPTVQMFTSGPDTQVWPLKPFIEAHPKKAKQANSPPVLMFCFRQSWDEMETESLMEILQVGLEKPHPKTILFLRKKQNPQLSC